MRRCARCCAKRGRGWRGRRRGWNSVSPLAVLQRGYAMVSDPAGHPLTTAAAVTPGARLRLRFADGEVAATADRPERQGRLPL